MTSPTTIPGIRDLKSALERERSRLRQNIIWLVDAERSLGTSQADETSAGGTMADIATDMTEQTLDASLERIERECFDEVEAALHRIADGNYGVCERCGTSIGLGRLVAVPWTRYCIACSYRNSLGHGRLDA